MVLESHQQMGYDRTITMFSPDGRLLQVEYAKKTVRLGNTVIGMVCSDGVLLVVDKRVTDKLLVAESIEKIFQIDDHIGSTVAGLVSDGRILIERAQMKAQQHRVTYDTPIDTLTIVKDICDLKQICTQSGGLRPFGVSLLVVGIDELGGRLFLTEPSGIYFQYNATSVGESAEEVNEILNKEYKKSMTIEQGMRLACKALKTVLGTSYNFGRIQAAVIKNKERKFTKMDSDDVKKIVGA